MASASLSVCVSLIVVALIHWIANAPPEAHIPSAQENANATAEALRKQDNAKTAVELDCQQESLPIHVPPNESAHVVILNKKRITLQRWGLYEIENSDSVPMIWPDKKLLDQSKGKPNGGVFIFRCVASNEGSTKLLNVVFTFNISFSTSPAPPFEVIANPLDASGKFTFYFVNTCPVSAFVVAQRSYSAQILGENERRSYTLLMPDRSPVQGMMQFFPSSVSWDGAACG